jgi:hypothetical protein
MHKGVEIHPALNASNDILDLFPDYENIGMIESRIPELQKGN